MRGHGQSDYPEDDELYSAAHTVADMAAILRACGETRAVIGGLSLGGVMSMEFHLRHPEMTRALMLFDTGPGFRNPQAREEWNARARQRGRRIGVARPRGARRAGGRRGRASIAGRPDWRAPRAGC